ncbi:glycoside hydrolase family 125 protein [Frondihabitans sp. PAMC 28766]|uniref:glycoside hydrolase family 125 protein n=1 Tax=Frondihabitans sp. PAMC 28766 TaxID=1795630 RepID=UPI0012FF74C3|nr:glycoside hydrolase family 125 protein [Frondihabitans sp. PAMC 28766]
MDAAASTIATVLGEDAARAFARTMRTNLSRVARPLDDGTVFVLTGDIPAMWLRDSAAQLRPYLLLCDGDRELQDVIIAVLRRQLSYLLTDPYANSFTESVESWHSTDRTAAGPSTWERKFELDSLCYPLELAHRLWTITGRDDFFDAEFEQACQLIIDVAEKEEDHETKSAYRFVRPHGPTTDTLVRDGKGRRTKPIGLIWSAFRPSDDACELGFNIPGNMFAVVALRYMADILNSCYQNTALAHKAAGAAGRIDASLHDHALFDLPTGEQIFAYEVDGYGKAILMDDANMPSLLSAPLTGYLSASDPTYLATRSFVLSLANPYYFDGSAGLGVGSAHTPHGYIWPIAIAVEGLTSLDRQTKLEKIQLLLRTTAGTGQMHESFDADYPSDFTRDWFSWADAMFCELVLDTIGIQFPSRASAVLKRLVLGEVEPRNVLAAATKKQGGDWFAPEEEA